MRLWGDDLLLHSPMPVRWYRPRGERWARLDEVDLEDPRIGHAIGVYVIWRLGPVPRVLRVGQGVVRDEIAASRRDRRLRRRAGEDICVTWASIATPYRDGVVAYLTSYYDPQVRGAVPDAEPIAVELP